MTLKNFLIDRIRAEGPIPFELFMEISLYHPEGFFGGEHVRSTRGGDFMTSPEVSRLFGETLAKYVEAERSRIGDPFAVIEVGAGSGSLLASLLDEIEVDAWAVEKSAAARAVLEDLIGSDRVASSMEELSAPFRGVILANELIDNLPMAIAQKISDAWRERWVGVEGERLVWVDAAPRPDVVVWLEAFAGGVSEGGWVEVQLQAQQWLNDAIGSLTLGSLLLFDYGDTKEGLESRRAEGTLRTYRAHHLGPHPLDRPGETDITADVNFSALVETAQSLPRTEVSLTRQEDFLSHLGLQNRLEDLRRSEMSMAADPSQLARLRARSLKTEAETLLHPRGLGDFRVLSVMIREPGEGLGAS